MVYKILTTGLRRLLYINLLLGIVARKLQGIRFSLVLVLFRRSPFGSPPLSLTGWGSLSICVRTYLSFQGRKSSVFSPTLSRFWKLVILPLDNFLLLPVDWIPSTWRWEMSPTSWLNSLKWLLFLERVGTSIYFYLPLLERNSPSGKTILDLWMVGLSDSGFPLLAVLFILTRVT